MARGDPRYVRLDEDLRAGLAAYRAAHGHKNDNDAIRAALRLVLAELPKTEDAVAQT